MAPTSPRSPHSHMPAGHIQNLLALGFRLTVNGQFTSSNSSPLAEIHHARNHLRFTAPTHGDNMRAVRWSFRLASATPLALVILALRSCFSVIANASSACLGHQRGLFKSWNCRIARHRSFFRALEYRICKSTRALSGSPLCMPSEFFNSKSCWR